MIRRTMSISSNTHSKLNLIETNNLTIERERKRFEIFRVAFKIKTVNYGVSLKPLQLPFINCWPTKQAILILKRNSQKASILRLNGSIYRRNKMQALAFWWTENKAHSFAHALTSLLHSPSICICIEFVLFLMHWCISQVCVRGIYLFV